MKISVKLYLLLLSAQTVSCVSLPAAESQATTTSRSQTKSVTITHQLPPATPAAPIPMAYAFKPLSPPPGYYIFSINGINDLGQVVGSCQSNTSSQKVVVVWTNGQPQIYPSLSNSNQAQARGINLSGTVTGFAEVPQTSGGPVNHAFTATSVTVSDLNIGYSFNGNFGNAINDSGQIAGNDSNPNGQKNPGSTGLFLWHPASQTGPAGYGFLPLPAGAISIGANGMNNAGAVVGGSYNGTTRRPFIYANGASSYLASGGTPYFINNNNEALGDASDFSAPVYWSPAGALAKLPLLSGVYDGWSGGISDRGEIVGSGSGDTWDDIPMYWKSPTDQPINLNNLTTLPQGWILTDAMAMSPGGAIAGWAYFNTDDNYFAFALVPTPQMAVDANRDGQIHFDSEKPVAANDDTTTAAKPFRFWLNDDNDGAGGDTGGDDIPGVVAADYLTPLNGGDMGNVHGVRDLVDWFPVAFDIKQLLTALPPSSTVKYKLKQADGAVNFVYTNLTRDQAFTYQRSPLSRGFGPDLSQAPGNAYKRQITAAGVDLFNAPTGSPQFLDAIQNHNGGVILMEGRTASNAPLVLSIENNGSVVAEVKLYLSINGVETMFRHLNLRDLDPATTGLVGSKGDTAPATSMGDPTGFPDAQNSSSDHWLIFLHGFNVGGQAARGWNAETFKRFYWSGNKAKFVGVSWFGNPSDPVGPAPSDYHLSVRNALATSFHLASAVNALPGFKSTVSHSLGCGVVASAISDHGMLVNKACFVDAALARECFDGELAGDANGMTPSFWRNYDPTFYATNWYQRFGASDGRSKLTWRNRFSNAESDVSNFYSSTENVLSEYDGDVPEWVFNIPPDTLFAGGTYSWVFQEKAKGARENYLLGYTHAGSYYMGWGFNLTDPMFGDPQWYFATADNFGTPGRRPKTPGEIGPAALWLDTIKRTPVFKTGWGRWDPNHPDQALIDTGYHDGPDWIFNLYDAIQGNTQASDPFKRAQLLAEAIPALTWPVGSHPVTAFGTRNYPLTALIDQSTWPRGFKENTSVSEWRHSDMHDVAYLYLYRVFDQLSNLTNQ